MSMTSGERNAYVRGFLEGANAKDGFSLILLGKNIHELLKLIVEDEERRNPIDFYNQWSEAVDRCN